MNMPCVLICFILTVYNITQASSPNILVIVADDMGWADVGYHGSEIKTPNIDELCRDGVELDQHYVSPMCTPTRVGFLTGRYPSRFGNTAPSNTRVLPWGTATIASELKKQGYETAISGKWHLGSKTEWGAKKYGFDHSYGSLAGGINPWSHYYKIGEYMNTWHRNDVLIEEKGHATDLFTEEAIRFLKVKRDRPFFLYLPYTAVHTPFDEPKEWLDKASHIPEDRRQYAACAQHMDHSIGKVIQTLKEEHLFDDTLILFFSDNGGTTGDDSLKFPDTKITSAIKGLNQPLRGWKTNLFEGGIRVPAFIHWKGQLNPGKLKAPIHVTDWLPTILSVINADTSKDLKLDGKNISSLLRNPKTSQPRTLYWQGIHHKSSALRQGDWKLILLKNKKNVEKLLFNLAHDPYEEKNLVELYPERVKELSELIEKEESKDNDALPKKS